jgi:nucleotide-binding universal stress UspA family protein
MFERILVSLDGSPESEAIFDEVERVAGPRTAVDLLHVVEHSGWGAEAARAYLQRAGGRLSGRLVGIHLRTGAPEDEIPRTARTLGADLIALTPHARRGLARLFPGSVAETVVRQASVPVLLRRPDLVRPRKPLERILVPIDGSPESRLVLDSVRHVSRPGSVEVILLQVLTGLAVGADPAPESASPLRTTAYKLEREGMRTRPMVVFGAPADQILDQARLLDVDLIAMANTGRKGLSRAFRRSVSFAVLRHADRAVLLHRSASGAEAGFVAQPLHVQQEES